MTKKIAKREAANVYGSIYADNLKKVARQAFLDGMVFWEAVKSGAVTADMVDGDFFAILRESNG
jgi:hypothetical protein